MALDYVFTIVVKSVEEQEMEIELEFAIFQTSPWQNRYFKGMEMGTILIFGVEIFRN